MDAKKLYAMKLGEEMQCGWYITRVPGGWIYGQGNGEACVFVPFHNEFQPDPPTDEPLPF